MSPDSLGLGPSRSSAAVNEDIRALWSDPRVQLADDERAALEALYEEWAAAVRAETEPPEIVEAA